VLAALTTADELRTIEGSDDPSMGRALASAAAACLNVTAML
jgi:hypothetical protein